MELDRVPWSRHVDQMVWNPGEHVILIGPTGRGKTVLMRNLIRVREQKKAHILIIATKAKDKELGQFAPQRYITKRALKKHPRGYFLTRSWENALRVDHDRVLLWVKYRGPSSITKQKKEATRALETIFAQGGWTVVVDELRWFGDRLRLESWIVDLYLQGRSLGITALSGTQRPRHVPLEVYSNSMHFYIWGTQDREDLRRLSGIGGIDTDLIRQSVADLRGHDVLYIDALRKRIYVTRAPKPAR